jgi:hypothetical protein
LLAWLKASFGGQLADNATKRIRGLAFPDQNFSEPGPDLGPGSFPTVIETNMTALSSIFSTIE